MPLCLQWQNEWVFRVLTFPGIDSNFKWLKLTHTSHLQQKFCFTKDLLQLTKKIICHYSAFNHTVPGLYSSQVVYQTAYYEATGWRTLQLLQWRSHCPLLAHRTVFLAHASSLAKILSHQNSCSNSLNLTQSSNWPNS